MQIHELNNFSGALNDASYLAVDNGNDTGKVSVPELLNETKQAIDQLDTFLNARIDNIIAGGTAPSEAEVTDARFGADGIVYPSLGDAIRGQVTNLKDDLNTLFVEELLSSNEMVSWDRVYIKNDGTQGTDNGNSGYYFQCEPNTLYFIKASSEISGWVGIGCTSAASMSGASFSKIFKKNGFEETEFVTENDSNYIFFYAPTANIGDITVYQYNEKAYAKAEKNIAFVDENVLTMFGKEGEKSYKYNLEFERGSIDNAGQPAKNLAYFRSPDFIPTNKTNLFLDGIPANVGVYVFFYDSEKTYQDTNLEKYVSRTILTSKWDYIKLVCVPNPLSGTITEADCDAITLSLQPVYFKDENTLDIILEGGKYTSGYTSYASIDYRSYKRTPYFIKTNGAKAIRINGLSSGAATIYSYGSDGTYLGYKDISLPSSNWGMLESGTAFVRFYLSGVIDLSSLKSVSVTLLDPTSKPEQVKNFRVARPDPYEFLTFKLTDTTCATARLMLPPNYSYDGEKVPLILWLDGSGNFAVWAGGFSTAKLPYLQYLRDEGFAILSVFGWSNKMVADYPSCGSAYPYPVPTCIKCLDAGIDYVLDRYNIDPDEIHIMSKSQGGQCSLYFASYPIKKGLKSIGMFSPVLDYLSMPGESMYADTRKAIAKDLGLEGDTAYFESTEFVAYSDEAKAFFIDNISQIVGLNEAWTSLVGGIASDRLNEAIADSKTFWTESRWQHPELTDIYNHTERAKIAKIPVKIWGASDDAATPYPKMVEVVEQLKNGGCEAVLETLPRGTGDHSCADVPPAGVNRVASVTTALGITYTDVPVGWVENVEWIRLHMAK